MRKTHNRGRWAMKLELAAGKTKRRMAIIKAMGVHAAREVAEDRAREKRALELERARALAGGQQ